MLLSQAILLGSIVSEQGKGPNSTYYFSQKKCALGAVMVATGYKGIYVYNEVIARWPWALNAAPCPACDGNHIVSTDTEKIVSLIWYLNDVHGWTRPQIAAWIASIEPKEEQVVVEEQCLVSHGQAI